MQTRGSIDKISSGNNNSNNSYHNEGHSTKGLKNNDDKMHDDTDAKVASSEELHGINNAKI